MSRKRFYSPSGSAIEPKHGFLVEDGKLKFGVIGEVNVAERINAAGKGVTLYELIEKYVKSGDESILLQKLSNKDIDLTIVPGSLIELYNLKEQAQLDFYKFPVDFRALFNHDIAEYFDSIRSNTVEEKIKSYFELKGKDISSDLEVKDEPIQ